jgi:hypothetical protein
MDDIGKIKDVLVSNRLHNDVNSIIVSYLCCIEHNCLLYSIGLDDISICDICMKELQDNLSKTWWNMQTKEERKRIRSLF